MGKDKLELLITWITAILFVSIGSCLLAFVQTTAGQTSGISMIGIGVSLLSTVLGLNLVFNSIPHWRLSIQEKKEALLIRKQQFAQKAEFIQTLKPSEETKAVFDTVKEKAKPIIDKLLSKIEKKD